MAFEAYLTRPVIPSMLKETPPQQAKVPKRKAQEKKDEFPKHLKHLST